MGEQVPVRAVPASLLTTPLSNTLTPPCANAQKYQSLLVFISPKMYKVAFEITMRMLI
jgi:hypothetical protein